MEHHIILRVIAKLLIPFILLFALYVQFHGDYGPGGGFQAGVIFAAGFILYGLIYGVETLKQVIPPICVELLSAAGVLLYMLVGITDMLSNGEFLNYSVMFSSAVQGQHIGILVIELGVGITVAATMLLFFYSFSQFSSLED